MKILFDYQIFSMQKYGGISRYFVEILKSGNILLPILISENHYLKQTSRKFIRVNANNTFIRGIFGKLNAIFSIIIAPMLNFDIYHPTYYNPFLLKLLQNKPLVITVHDMIHEKFPEYFNDDLNTKSRKLKMVNKACKIIAVSENTKKDIITYYGIPADKIKVIYHGDSLVPIFPDFSLQEKIRKKYVLFTGQRGGYKNFHNLVFALKDFLINDRNLALVCAGGGEFNSEEVNFIKKNGLFDKIYQFSCSDNQLKALYQKAEFFIYPSLYEGFGIPLLEAMSSSCPILCSNTSCFPEVAANAAIYFDPSDILDIKEKIAYALNNDLTSYKKLGDKRVRFFKWETAKQETIKLYQEIMAASS